MAKICLKTQHNCKDSCDNHNWRYYINMAATHSNVTAEFELKDKSESNANHKTQNCCLQLDTHITTLVNDVKTLHEIVNILSEEW